LSSFKSKSEFGVHRLIEAPDLCGSVIFPGSLRSRIAGTEHAFWAMLQAVSEEPQHQMGQRQDLPLLTILLQASSRRQYRLSNKEENILYNFPLEKAAP